MGKPGDLHARGDDMKLAAALCGQRVATVTAASDNKIGVTCRDCLNLLGLDEPITHEDVLATERDQRLRDQAELEELRTFRRAVLELAVPQWRPAGYTRNRLLNDLRALLGRCEGCGHPDHLEAACPAMSKEDRRCACRS